LVRQASHASNATGTSKIKKKSKSVAPVVVEEEPTQLDDTPSVKEKRKKKKATTTIAEPPRTLVLSAESLGIPTGGRNGSGTAPPVAKKPGLSRSNTVTSHATATTTGTVTAKKKKKKVPTSAEEHVAIPTAADLASSLPSATNTYNPITSPLPLPTNHSAPQHKRDTSAASEGASVPTVTTAGAAGKVPKAVTAGEKRSKRDAALHGTSDWVSHGPATAAAAASGHPHKHSGTTGASSAKLPVKRDVAEGEDSLMTIMDRAEGGEDRTPSRKYGAGAAVRTGGIQDETAARQGLAVPRTPTTAGAGGGLTKRKSVRMADPSEQPTTVHHPESSSLHVPPGSMSPASSVRSVPGGGPGSGELTPSKGIIKNVNLATTTGSPSLAGLPPTQEWTTRRSARMSSGGGGGGGDDTSDESDEGEEYRKARKAFAKRAKGMDEVMSGTFTAAEKGKGRALA
jgi:hypothetical protein